MKEVWLSTPCDLIHKEISEPVSIAKTSTTSDLQLHPKSEPTTYSLVTFPQCRTKVLLQLPVQKIARYIL